MKTMKKGTRKPMTFVNNKGLTLVELIITIAIVGIVSGSIVGFMVTGANGYTRTNSDVNLQYEVQLTMNQLQDMIIDADKGITYERGSEITTETVLEDSLGSITEEDIKVKRIIIYNRSNAYKIEWNKEEQKLYYYKYELTESGGVISLNPITGPILMADYVSGMGVNLTRLSADNIARIDLDFTLGTRNYSTYSNITLRNRVRANSDPDEIYDGVLEEGDGSLADGITLVPETVVLWPGNTQTFIHHITSTGGGYPSQEVNWEIIGIVNTGTSITGGVLTVDGGETSNSFLVRAAAKHTQPGMEVSVTSQVLIKQVSGVAVTVIPGGTYNNTSLFAGDTVQLKAMVSGPNIESENSYDQEVIWTVLEGPVSNITANGLLSVASNAEPDSRITIEARSKRDNLAAGTIVLTVAEENLEFDLKVEPGSDTEVYRNESINLVAELTQVQNPDDYTVAWEYDLKNVSNDGYYIEDTATEEMTKSLFVKSNLDHTKNFEILVTAVLKRNGAVVTRNGQNVTASLILTIPKVKIMYKNFGTETYSESLTTYLALNQTTYVYYKTVGIITNSNPSWSFSDSLKLVDQAEGIQITAVNKKKNLNTTAIIYPKNSNSGNAITVYIKSTNVEGTSYYSPSPNSVDFMKEGGSYYYSDTVRYEYEKVNNRWKLTIYQGGGWYPSYIRYWNNSRNEWKTN